MRKFLAAVWRVLTAPFRFLFWLLALPFRLLRGAHAFLTEVPEERSVLDAFGEVVNASDSFFSHVDALRRHLIRILLVIFATVGVSFVFTPTLIDYLSLPAGGIDTLRAIEVTESVGVFMKVALLSGIAIALPYIIFEIWLFAAPGLMPRTRQVSLVTIPLALVLFLGGMAFAFYVMLPAALPFLLNFMGIQTELRPASYFGFVTGVMFWIGISFEFPLLIYFLSMIGMIKPGVLAKQWRLAMILIAVLAAAITPTVDPVNMALVMAPMTVLYFISIGLSYMAYAGRRRASSAGA